MMKLNEAIARMLAEQSGTPLFGVVGDANAYMVHALIRQHGGRYIAAANENGATLMAIGAAMASGELGLATVTHGPALTNCVTALAEGVRSNTAVVLLCGDTRAGDRENLQNIDQRAVVLASGAGFEMLHTPETALADLARAARRAVSGRRPVVFNMPADLLWRDVEYTPEPWSVPPFPKTVLEGAPLDQAVGIIAAARRPVVLAGRGAIDPVTRDALLRLARRIEAPLATTMRAKSLFRGEDHVLGVFGTVSTPQAAEAIATSDCIIAFGAGLNFHTTAEGVFVRGKRVIQVADRACDLGRGAAADVPILGRCHDVAETLMFWLDEAEIAPSGFTRDLPAQGLDAPFPARHARNRSGTVDFLTTLEQLESILPKDKVLVTDAGRWMVRSYASFSTQDPIDLVTSASFGAIGLGMASAIGAAAVNPGRTTVMLCGDGGFMLGNLSEFNTAVRERMDIIAVVFDDGSYGAEHIQLREKQIDPGISLFDWPEFADVAKALGGDGITVRSSQDLAALPESLAARDRSRPLLVTIKLDPDEVAMW
ncbi:MAG: thiamine pyrophosphate-binding protein [Pararhodobacter sp.]|nr:thiamine pyrophosphate-binding protein [Pararhodobacter sp.]